MLASELVVREAEIYRYLGYRASSPDEAVRALVTESVSDLIRDSSPKAMYALFPVSAKDGDVDFGFASIHAPSLSRHLEGCVSCVIFAATLGSGADMLIRRASRTSEVRAMIYQSAATELIEAYCDRLNAHVVSSLERDGMRAVTRFSPGYGDFPLEFQNDIFRVLDCKRIGLSLTDSLMMIPSKSVTAVIGVKPEKHSSGRIT